MTDEETVKRVLGCRGRGNCGCGRDPEDDSGFYDPTKHGLPESGDKNWGTTIFEDQPYIREVPRHPSSQNFVNRVMAWVELHDQKQQDYGTDQDPFANIREGARQLGLPAWIGCVIRMNDKMRRLNTAAKQYIETGEINLANEGVIDSFDDLGVYSGIGAVCFEEEKS